MSIADQITRINQNIASAYVGLEAKGAVMPPVQNSSNLADTIDSISSGGEPECKDVNFFDYEGTLLYSYTFAEALQLSALPALPATHTGLVAQGWNYTLQQICASVRSALPVAVGAHYTTSDGSTRFYFQVDKGVRIPSLKIWVNMDADTSATVDWGDGTIGVLENTSSSAAAVYAEKTDYAEAAADMTLCVRIIGGSYKLGRGSDNENFLGDTMCPLLKKVELGSACKGVVNRAFYNCYSVTSISVPQGANDLGTVSSFQNCYALTYLTLPSGVSTIGPYAFAYCYSLRCVSLPSTVTSIYEYAFSDCPRMVFFAMPLGVQFVGQTLLQHSHNLEEVVLPSGLSVISNYMFNMSRGLHKVTLPSGVTQLGRYAWQNCSGLLTIEIPATVTSIAVFAFSGCSHLYTVDLTAFTDPAALPTLSSTNAFQGVTADVKFLVADQAMLDAFSTATNWSDFASRFVIV